MHLIHTEPIQKFTKYTSSKTPNFLTVTNINMSCYQVTVAVVSS